MKKGLTIVELLVTMFILVLVLSVAHLTYTHLLKGFKSGSLEETTEIAQLVGIEILRLDLEHIGYGIPKDEDNKIIEVTETDLTKRWNSNEKLIVRSSLNNTNEETRGWLFIEVDDTGNAQVISDGREKKSNSVNIVLIDSETKNLIANNSACSNPTSATEAYFSISIDNTTGEIAGLNQTCIYPSSGKKYYLGFPIDTSITDACNISYCNKIEYNLSLSPSEFCNKDTKNLKRTVGDSNGEPIIECVADWKVTVDLDTDGDGKVDTYDTTFPMTNDNIRKQLKLINVYILVQIGKKKPDFSFNKTKPCGTYTCIDDPVVDRGIYLVLPNNYQNYKWKVIKLSVKPMNL